MRTGSERLQATSAWLACRLGTLFSDLIRDADLLPDVQHAAQQLARQYPDHVQPLLDRWIAQGQHFAQV